MGSSGAGVAAKLFVVWAYDESSKATVRWVCDLSINSGAKRSVVTQN